MKNRALSRQIKPFLKLPFDDPTYRIYAGWFYSGADLIPSGSTKHHFAIDFELTHYQATVCAAASGWAVASYHTFPKMEQNESGQWVQRLYQGKSINNGLGNHVFIYHPEQKIWTGYGHLRGFALSVRPHAPKQLGPMRFNPIGYKVNPVKLPHYPFATWVNQGDTIGSVGDTGLGWGYLDYPDRPNPKEFPAWDKPHLHFEVFRRFGTRKLKHAYDPYGVEEEVESYPDPSRPDLPMGKSSPNLWLIGSDGLPQLASYL